MAWTERYVRADAPGGGDGTADSNTGATASFTIAEAITDAATPHTNYRYNVKAGSYAPGTGSLIFNAAGTTTGPIWWRGYNNSIGDMDGLATSHGTFASGTSIPAFTFTTGQFQITGPHQIFSNIDVTGASVAANTAQVVTGTAGGPARLHRVRVQNTAANANGKALLFGANGQGIATRCWFKATTTATWAAANSVEAAYFSCSFEGGADALQLQAASSTSAVLFCTVTGAAANGINVTTTNASRCVYLLNNSIHGSGVDGIHLGGLPLQALIANNVVANSGGGGSGWGLNNATGANTNAIHRVSNDYYSNASGAETGFGDSPAFSGLTESVQPFLAPGGDLSLASNAVAAWGAAVPGPFPNQTYTGHLSAGAVQPSPSAPAAGSGVSKGRLFT